VEWSNCRMESRMMRWVLVFSSAGVLLLECHNTWI
jgi:hypothetical protein